MKIHLKKNSLKLIYLLMILFLALGILATFFASALDFIINDYFSDHRNNSTILFYTFMTSFGEVNVVLGIFCVMVINMALFRKEKYIIPIAINFILISGLIIITKSLFQRSRPDLAVYFVDSYSYPSGHAAIALGFYGYIFSLLYRFLKKGFVRILIISLGTLFVLLIGLSRLVLGVHYFTDIVGGYLLGVIVLLMLNRFTDIVERLD